MKVLLALLPLLLLSFAGCLAGEPDDGPEPTSTPSPDPVMPEDPMPEGDGHDHGAGDQHRFLWNYDFAARDPMLSNAANAAGLHALDVAGDHLFGAVYGSHPAAVDGGLVIWDISEPQLPVQTGRLALHGAVGGDRSLEATDDGDFVVLATEPVTCFGQVGTNPADVYLIDARDPSQPIVADVVSVVGGGLGDPLRAEPALGIHSVVVHRFGDQDYAFLMGNVYRIERGGPSGATLVPTGASVNVGHDLYVRDTPWGDVWGLSANGGRNFQVYDLTDPEGPVEVAVWEGDDVRYLHTADAAFFPDGQALIALTSEDWEDHPSMMWIFDATELKDHAGEPRVLEPASTWMNPGEHTATGLSFSLHNPRWNEDGVLSISSYHGGLWQLDFRNAEDRLREGGPPEIAYAVYADGEPPAVEDPVYDAVESELCGLGVTVDAPTYMDVELGPDGILYAADVYMGLYTFVPTVGHPVYGAQE